MLTEISLLPVYNKLYELGLEEADIERIIKRAKTIKDTNYVYSFIANETLVRLYPHSGKKAKQVELIPYDPETKTASSSNKFIRERVIPNVPCYTFNNSNDETVFKGVDPLKLDAKDKDMFIAATCIVKTVVVNSSDDLKKALVNKFKNSFFSGKFIENDLHDTDVTPTQLLAWAFDVNLDNAINKIPKLRNSADYIYQFIDIGERDNVRVAVAKRDYSQRYYYSRGHTSDLTFIIADPDQACYDYLDTGREFYCEESNVPCQSFRHGITERFPKMFMLDDEVQVSPDEDVYMDILNRNADKDAFLVDNLAIESVIRRFQRRHQQSREKSEQAQKLLEKFKTRLEKLSATGGTLNLNGVALTKHSFEYEGQKLSCDQIELPTLLTEYGRHRDLENLNFEVLSKDFFTKLTTTIMTSYTDMELTGSIGDVNFKIENKVNVTAAGNTVKLAYMNGTKIKKDEIGEIIERGLCFAEQDAFDNFIKQVGACSLMLHKYLNEGVVLHVKDDYRNTIVDFKIPLVRRSGKNFIVLAGKEYSVADSNRLIRLEKSNYMHEAINALLNPKVVRIDGPDDIAHIIRKGSELHQEHKDKNKNLINRVEELFNIKVSTIINNGQEQRGYIIDGKLTKYFLDIGRTDKETIFDRLRVFSYPDMNYVCMIDKGIDQTGPSNLVNRIYALHNDSMIASEVSTLNQKT